MDNGHGWITFDWKSFWNMRQTRKKVVFGHAQRIFTWEENGPDDSANCSNLTALYVNVNVCMQTFISAQLLFVTYCNNLKEDSWPKCAYVQKFKRKCYKSWVSCFWKVQHILGLICLVMIWWLIIK